MSAPTHQFNANNDPTLSNTAATAGVSSSFRNSVLSASSENQSTSPPLLPPRPNMGIQSNYAMSPYSYGGMGSYGMNSYGGYGAGGYGGFGGGYGMTGMGMSPYSGFNRYGGMGPMYGDIENRFIQMAEENSRPAFDSIQSVVNAVGSVAMMLENTFFALTSSFRAILGVAENFGRLRSLFAQFWSTFAVIRSLNWLIRKLLVLLGIRTEAEFKAWTEAVAATQGIDNPEQPRGSSWPILLFFGVITAAPYIVLRMLSSLNNNIREKLNDPTTWQDPLRAVAQHEFQATSPQELSFNTGQVLTIAPQHLQTNLWQSGWLMASTDGQHAGLVPVTYLKVFKVTHQGGPNTNNDQSVNPSNPNNSVPEKPVEPNVADLDKFYGQEL